MKTICDTKEYIATAMEFCDGFGEPIMSAIAIAEAADALFDMSTTAHAAGQPTRNDRMNALYREVRQAREEGFLPVKVRCGNEEKKGGAE